MSRKNSPVSVLQQNRTPFLLIGLLLALSFVILAFQLRFPALEVEPPDVAYIANPEYVEEWSTHRPKQKYRQKQQPAARQKIVTTTALPDLPDDDQRQAEAPPIDDEFFHLPTEKTTDRVIREPVRNPEQMPAFPGGEAGLMGYLSKTPYCEAARDIGISGMVYISFVVGRDGRVREVELLRGLFPCLDQAALEQARHMPRWPPGRQGRSSVAVRMVVPFRFQLLD